MRKIISTLFLSAGFILVSCGGGNGENIAEKKSTLDKLKKEHNTLAEKIALLEKEIAKSDTNSQIAVNAKLVGVMAISTQNFSHYIDLQGRIESENTSYISPRLGGGQVRAIYVKRGDQVSKGQLLLKLDDAIIRQQILASKQNTETIKTQINFAKDVYNRRNNLWKQGIGTEIELVSARTNVETLEKQLNAAVESIKIQQEQLKATSIYSDVAGIADEVNIRVGEMFTGFMGNLPQIRIVNNNNLKVITDVPENYTEKVKKGSNMIVTLPDSKKSFNTSVSVAGKLIDPNNRSFKVEAKMPTDPSVHPNAIAQVSILDYRSENAIAIPVNAVGTDENGKYVFVAANENGKLIAKKKLIKIGQLYNNLIEVTSGLEVGEQLINDGFQNIYHGQSIRTK